MDTLFANLARGFSVAVSLQNLGLCFVGTLVGTLIGVLPGVGPIATIAMLLPLTFNFDPTGALIMLAGIYYGAQYGGSTTAILINVPGEATSVVTTLDGHQMSPWPSLSTGRFWAATRWLRGPASSSTTLSASKTSASTSYSNWIRGGVRQSFWPNGFSPEYIDGFMFLSTLPRSTVVAPPKEGHLITYFGKQHDVVDSEFSVVDVKIRLNDTELFYTTKFKIEALRILEKYDAEYFIISAVSKSVLIMGHLNWT